jgi:molecular chaperone HscB
MNYFEFMDLPIGFQVDEAALRRAYLANSRKFHPDFHTQADETAQIAMLEQSSFNNEAFQTLSKSDARMAYVLRLKGLLGEEGGQIAPPQDFLMEMMEINEALMELEFDFDEKQFDVLKNNLQNIENQLDSEINPILEKWTESTAAADVQLVQIRNYFFKKKYLLRIRENLSKFAAS